MNKQWATLVRLIITIAIWLIVIIYAHKLGHLYLDDLKATINTPYLSVTAQIVFFTILISAIWVSLPFLPKLNLRIIAFIGFWISLFAIGHELSHTGLQHFKDYLGYPSRDIAMGMLLAAGLIYLLILAIPFVPGVELGIIIILLFGVEGALMAYGATIAGILLSFSVGRLLPYSKTQKLLDYFGLTASAQNPEATFQNLVAGRNALVSWLGNLFLNHRYLALAICLNLPGNSIIGGGGGIGFICGLSRQFRWRGFILTLIVAASPVPLLYLMGLVQFEPMLENHGPLHAILEFLESLTAHQ